MAPPAGANGSHPAGGGPAPEMGLSPMRQAAPAIGGSKPTFTRSITT